MMESEREAPAMPCNERVGIVSVSMELLAELLHFPVGHRIVDVRRSETCRFEEFEILCEGPTIPESPLQATPRLLYTVTRTVIEGRFDAITAPVAPKEPA